MAIWISRCSKTNSPYFSHIVFFLFCREFLSYYVYKVVIRACKLVSQTKLKIHGALKIPRKPLIATRWQSCTPPGLSGIFPTSRVRLDLGMTIFPMGSGPRGKNLKRGGDGDYFTIPDPHPRTLSDNKNINNNNIKILITLLILISSGSRIPRTCPASVPLLFLKRRWKRGWGRGFDPRGFEFEDPRTRKKWGWGRGWRWKTPIAKPTWIRSTITMVRAPGPWIVVPKR